MSDISQRDIAAKAAKLKKDGEEQREWLDRQEDTAGEGMAEKSTNEDAARGALDAEGHRPVLERSRKVR